MLEDSIPEKEKISNFSLYKCCFVPECKNTTITAPEKVFCCVPASLAKRKAWCEAVGYPLEKMKSIRHCCEDHFNLKEDLENYLQWKIMGCNKMLKENVLPRKVAKDPLTTVPKKSKITIEHAENLLPNTPFYNAKKCIYTYTESPNIPIAFVDVNNIGPHNTLDLDENLNCSTSLLPTSTSTTNKFVQCEKEVEHIHVQAKPKTLVKSTQTIKEKKRKVLTKDVGLTCDIIPYHNYNGKIK